MELFPQPSQTHKCLKSRDLVWVHFYVPYTFHKSWLRAVDQYEVAEGLICRNCCEVSVSEVVTNGFDAPTFPCMSRVGLGGQTPGAFAGTHCPTTQGLVQPSQSSHSDWKFLLDPFLHMALEWLLCFWEYWCFFTQSVFYFFINQVS